jgi:hypothetical protein
MPFTLTELLAGRGGLSRYRQIACVLLGGELDAVESGIVPEALGLVQLRFCQMLWMRISSGKFILTNTIDESHILNHIL